MSALHAALHGAVARVGDLIFRRNRVFVRRGHGAFDRNPGFARTLPQSPQNIGRLRVVGRNYLVESLKPFRDLSRKIGLYHLILRLDRRF